MLYALFEMKTKTWALEICIIAKCSWRLRASRSFSLPADGLQFMWTYLEPSIKDHPNLEPVLGNPGGRLVGEPPLPSASALSGV